MKFHESDCFKLYQGNCIEVMKSEIEKESIDMIFADPPYKVSNDGVTCKSGKMTEYLYLF